MRWARASKKPPSSAVSSAYIAARASVWDSPRPARYRLPSSTQDAITSAATWRGARQLRVGWLRRLPPLYGQMARRPVPGELIRRWTDPVLSDPGIRRDLLAYCRSTFDKAALIADTEALRRFHGDVLVLWSPDNKVMPAQHGHRLAALMPRSRYAEIPGAYVLSMLDEPEAVAREMGAFLTAPAA